MKSLCIANEWHTSEQVFPHISPEKQAVRWKRYKVRNWTMTFTENILAGYVKSIIKNNLP